MVATSGVVLTAVVTLVLVRRVRLSRSQQLLREQNSEDQPAIRVSDPGPVLWMQPDFGEFLRRIGPSLAAATIAEGGIADLAGGHSVITGLLLALAVAITAWRWPMVQRAGQKTGWSAEAAVAAVLILAMARWAVHPGVNEQEARMHRPQGTADGSTSRNGRDLSGVILTFPTKPRETLLPPTPMKAGQQATAMIQPVRIEFNGNYWYFQTPDRRPGRDAKVVPGDPIRAKVRSTNGIPLQMEAHQRLPDHILLDRYGGIVVRMRDADNLPGLIRVSLLLRDETGPEPLMLGMRVLEASRRRDDESRPVIEEELRFTLIPSARGRHWVEMVIRVEPERGRAQAGAHVAVVDFLLEP